MIPLDQTVFLWLNLGPQTPKTVLNLALFGTLYLPHWILATTLTVALVGRQDRRGRAWRVLASMALAVLLAHWLKQAGEFPRPFTLGLGIQWLPHGKSAGFPSSHAAMAMAFAASACLGGRRTLASPAAHSRFLRPRSDRLLAAMPWAVRALLLGAALLLSWSRIALGLHFPSDVLAAWCVGAASAYAVHALAHAIIRRNSRKAPASG